MYKRTIYRMPNCIYVELSHSGRYGAPGMPRRKKQNVTKEAQEKANQKRREKLMAMKINMNFLPGDFHLVLTYTRENRCGMEEAKKNLKRFLEKLRYRYDKVNEQLKYIAVTAVGERGAVHHHIIINNIEGTTMKWIRKYWEMGRPYFTPLDEEGDYRKLAQYIFKQDTSGEIHAYTCSRNLVMPTPEVTIMKRATFGEPKPKKGYYVEKESVFIGINPVTGFLYQHYTLRKVRRKD